MVSFPYHSHIFTDSYGSGMGIVWEAYHNPLLGVAENPIDLYRYTGILTWNLKPHIYKWLAINWMMNQIFT